MGKEEKSNWNGTFRRVLRFGFFALLVALPAATASAQSTTSGLLLKKVCPSHAFIGDSVTCTLQVENQGGSTVTGLTVTNQVPSPGGPISTIAGCASSLAAADGTTDSGPDFTQCFATEVLDQECPGIQIVVIDKATVSGTDSTTGPVMNTATNAVIVSCTPGEPPPPPEAVPAASTAGLVLLALGLVGFGAKRIAKRS